MVWLDLNLERTTEETLTVGAIVTPGVGLNNVVFVVEDVLTAEASTDLRAGELFGCEVMLSPGADV